jgi:hypothetical protein
MKRIMWMVGALIGAALFVGAASAVVAEESGSSQKVASQTEAVPQTRQAEQVEVKIPAELLDSAAALAQSMQRVFIDPATGKFRGPSPEEMREIADSARRLSSTNKAAPRPFDLAAGGVGQVLPAELMSYSVVKLSADGEATVGCTDSAANALEAIAAPQSSTNSEDQ